MSAIERIHIPIPYALRSVNCYFIDGPLPTLIDAGINTPQARRRLKVGLSRLGSTLESIRRIIITHGHLDHAGMAGWIANRSQAKIFITALDHPKLTIPHEAGAQEMRRRYHRFLTGAGMKKSVIEKAIHKYMLSRTTFVHPMPKITIIEDGDEFDCNGQTLKVIATPGHTPGAICLFIPQNGVLFSGDTLLQSLTPTPVIELDNPVFNWAYPSFQKYDQSLNLLKKLSITSVYPGHGNVFEGHFYRITKIQEQIHTRKQQVLKIVKKLEKNNGTLMVEIVDRLFPQVIKKQIIMALSEVATHLKCLKQEGLISSKIRQNRIYHYTT